MKNIIKKIIKEEIGDFEWIKEVPTNPFDFYFNNGYSSVGIITHSNEEISKLLSILHSIGYDWYREVPPNLFSGNGNLIIWVTTYGNTNNIQFSDTDYSVDHMGDTDIIIDNPFF